MSSFPRTFGKPGLRIAKGSGGQRHKPNKKLINSISFVMISSFSQLYGSDNSCPLNKYLFVVAEAFLNIEN